MKLIYLFLPLFVILSANGQRRTTARTETTEVEQHPPSRGRGRSRFTTTQEFAQISESTKTPESTPPSRRVPSRKRVTESTDRRTTRPIEKPSRSAYEVEEVVNESPIDSFRRQSKSRVLTETHYEAFNAPKRKLFEPAQTISETPEELLKTLDNAAADSTVPETSSTPTETTHDVDVLGDFTDTTFKTNAIDTSSENPKSNEITREFTKSQLITTPKPTEGRRLQNGARRNNLRSRTNSVEVPEEHITPAPRSRTRTRATRKPEETSTQATNSRTVHRGSRRRPDSAAPLPEPTKRGPSVFAAEESQDVYRSRTGRRIGNSAPEKISIDITNTKGRDSGRKKTATPATTTQRTVDDHKKRASSGFQSRKADSSASFDQHHSRNADSLASPSSRTRSRSRDVIPALDEFSATTASTASTKGRFRSRDFPPIIDEQKLEVLPLFEDEPKTVRPVAKTRTRSRTRSVNSSDERLQMSATENDIKFSKPSEIPSRISVTRSQTVSVETRTETSVKTKQTPRKPQVKESVIAEVTEVTSKRTVSRRKHNDLVKENSISPKVKVDKPKVSVSQVVSNLRGKKKSEVNLADVKKRNQSGDGSDDVEETDNYPEAFKALLQAKKDKKESRPSSRPHFGVPTITTIVTSSAAPSTVISKEANKEDDDLENELDPKSSTTPKTLPRPTRKRLTLSTKSLDTSTTATTKKPTLPSRKSSKVVRSTSTPPSAISPPKEHKFHAKFSSKSTTSTTRTDASPSKSSRNSSQPRGLYSSRKNKEDRSGNREKLSKKLVESTLRSTQAPKSSGSKKSNKYSSKYRSDISSRGSATRSTTNAPAYIPTIPTAAYVPTVPTIMPPKTTVNTGAGTKDVDLGLEVISFDDPVNTVPSANLINEEFTSSTEIASVVKDDTTEKPVSIIERIINSISAISTTSPDPLKQTSTASTTESSSAILKLATKKSTKLDKTKTTLDETSQTYPTGTVAFTTEKPTTIIEKILSSLSAIKATDDINSNQVGKDFNTISFPPTTPVSRVTKSTSRTTLPAHISTSINPLSVLDHISEDQVLQKRTIGKLLALLNSLVSTTESPRLVVVTPKTSNFVAGTNSVIPNPLSSPKVISFSTTFESPATTTSLSTTSSTISTTSTVPPIISASTSLSEFTSGLASGTTTPQLFTSALDNDPPSTELNVNTASSNANTASSDASLIENRIDNVISLSADSQTLVTTSTLPTTQITQLPTTTSTPSGISQTETSGDIVATTVPIQTEASVQTTVFSATTQSSSEAGNTPQKDNSTPSILPLFLDSGLTSSSIESTTGTNTFPTTTEVGLIGTTDTETLFTYLSTTPTFQNFEVSPGSVSVFSANDLSNSITSDDNIFATVTIAGRSNFETTVATEGAATETSIAENPSPTTASITSADGTTETNAKTDDKNSIAQTTETVQSNAILNSSNDVSLVSNSVDSGTTETITTQNDVNKATITAGTTTQSTVVQDTSNQGITVVESTTIQANTIQAATTEGSTTAGSATVNGSSIQATALRIEDTDDTIQDVTSNEGTVESSTQQTVLATTIEGSTAQSVPDDITTQAGTTTGTVQGSSVQITASRIGETDNMEDNTSKDGPSIQATTPEGETQSAEVENGPGITTVEIITVKASSTPASSATQSGTIQDSTTQGDSVIEATTISIQATTAQSSTTTASAIPENTTIQTGSTQISTISGGTAERVSVEGSNTVQSGSDNSSSVENNIPVPNDISNATTAITDNNQTSATSSSNNISLSNRSGRLLNIVEEPVQNSLDVSTPSTTTSTTPDYFIFAVLNNNTVLRKKPPTIPNKEVPYVVVGFYPNNTVVRKFPNGTLVPMEQIIRVRGFDTRENPPPLPEITSNQVTNDPGSSADSRNIETVDQNTIPSVEANPLSLDSVSSTSNVPEISSSTTQSTTISTSTTTASESTSASTVGSISSATQSTITVVGPSSSTAQNVMFISTESSKVEGNSINSGVDSPAAPSTVSSTAVEPITNAVTTTPVSTVPAGTLVPTTVSSTTVESSTTQTPSPTLPTLSELLNGRTLEALSNIINKTNTNTNTNTNHQTQVNQGVTSSDSPTTTTIATPQTSVSIDPTTAAVMLPTATSVAPMETTIGVFIVTPAEITTSQIETTPAVAAPAPLSNRILENTGPQTTIPQSTGTTPPTTTTTTMTPPTTTTAPTTTLPSTTTRRIPPTTPRFTNTPTNTVLSLTTTPNPLVTNFPETLPPITFFPTFPTFLTTLFPNLLRITPDPPTTKPPKTTTIPSETIVISASTSQPTTVIAPRSGRISLSDTGITDTPPLVRRPNTTTRPRTTTTLATTTIRVTTTTTTVPTTTTTVPPTTTTTTTPVPTTTTTTAAPSTTTTTPTPTTTTTRLPTTTEATSTTLAPTITAAPQTTPSFILSSRSVPIEAATTVVPGISAAASSPTPKLKELTEQQKKDLETLAELEKQQAALLQQLTFLTSLNFGGNRSGGKRQSSDLANRVIALAQERDKSKTTTTSKPPKSIQDQLALLDEKQESKNVNPTIEEVLKQYNLNGMDVATTTSSSTHGKSNDAILAALLKEQGIVPSTPKSLGDQIKQAGIFSETTTTTTRKPKPRTQRPGGRLMQGLNWLLNVLSPQPSTTRRPVKPVKPKKPPVDQELLANSPTRLTPVVTVAPKPISSNTLSQDDIQKLIKQLETIQKDPNNADGLDFSHIKSLQNLINTDEGVQVMTNSQNGATSRVTTTLPTTAEQKQHSQRKRTTTALPSTVSNSVEDFEEELEETTTAKPKPSLPPLKLRPVPGLDDNSEPLIRGNLITAAVNVTRAISGFLGTALQDAAYQFTHMFSNGSDNVRNIFSDSFLTSVAASSNVNSNPSG